MRDKVIYKQEGNNITTYSYSKDVASAKPCIIPVYQIQAAPDTNEGWFRQIGKTARIHDNINLPIN